MEKVKELSALVVRVMEELIATLESEWEDIMKERTQLNTEMMELFERHRITKTKLPSVGSLLGEETFDMESTKQLDKSPLMSAGSLEEDISLRRPQHTETRRSQHCEDVSIFNRLISNIRQVFLSIPFVTKKKEAEERKSFVPEDTGTHQFYSRQYRDPEPASQSVRREGTDSGRWLLTQRSILRLESPPESHRSDKREMPDANGLSQLIIFATRFNKPEKSQGFNRKQKPLQQIWALLLSNPQDSQMSDRKQILLNDRDLQDGAFSNAMLCKPEETLDSEEKRKLVADELHPPMSSQPQETDTGGNRQRQMSETSLRASSDPPPFRKTSGPAVADQRRHFASSFLHRAGALLLFLLLFSVGVCSVTGNLCDQKRETLRLQKGEVALVCPVTADVHWTKQSVVISFVTNHTHEEVLGCDWLSKRKKHDCLQSSYGAELIEIQADSVLARLPEERVQQNRSYRCQLVPHHPEQPFTDCHLCYPVIPKDTSTTEVPTTVNHHASEAPKDTAGAGGLISPIAMIFIAISLLMILAVLLLVTLLFRNQRMYRNQRGQQYNTVVQESP